MGLGLVFERFGGLVLGSVGFGECVGFGGAEFGNLWVTGIAGS